MDIQGSARTSIRHNYKSHARVRGGDTREQAAHAVLWGAGDDVRPGDGNRDHDLQELHHLCRSYGPLHCWVQRLVLLRTRKRLVHQLVVARCRRQFLLPGRVTLLRENT